MGTSFHGDPIDISITVVNGEEDGSTVFHSAAVHGDELNGIKIAQEVTETYYLSDIYGALVCLQVLNVPRFMAQQRYIPIYDEDLN